MILRAKKWEEFQHYKDRDPPWIKLHKRMLDDRVFHRLPDASRALAPMVWLLCSESSDGTIKDAVAEISFRLRMTEKKAEEALNPLIEAGFFIVEQDASAVLAPCEQDATQRERQSRDREEEEGALASFIEAAGKRGWPKPQKLDASRRKKLRARLDEHSLNGWQIMLEKASASDFLCSKFALTLDWVLEPKNFAKVIEGNYDAKTQTQQGATAGLPPSEPWEQRMRGYKPGGFWKPNDWGKRPEEPGTRVPPSILATWQQGATQ